jgi:hypothetical protein
MTNTISTETNRQLSTHIPVTISVTSSDGARSTTTMATPEQPSRPSTQPLVSTEPAADTDTGSTLAAAVQPMGSSADTEIYYIFYRNKSSSPRTMA